MTAEKQNNTKKRKFFGLIVFLSLLLLINDDSSLIAKSNFFDNIKFPIVKSFKMRNGVKVFTIGDELPKITIFASVGFGKLYENKNNAGISGLIAKTISLAGSKKYPGQKLHEEIESIGGNVSVYSSWENTVISVKVLSRYKQKAFNIISDIISNPNFDEKYINIAKSLYIEEIKRNRDKPGNAAFEKVREIIFNGEGYGAVPGEETVKSFSRSFIVKTYKKYFVGGNMVIGISSNSSFNDIKKNSIKYFSSIRYGNRIDYKLNIKELRKKIAANSSKIYLIPKNLPQATIVVGTILPDIGYNGKYAITLLNYILGGGSFNSRLMKEIRVKKGLAYAVQSIARFRYRTGLFISYAQTKNKSAEQVLSIMLDNITRLAKVEVEKNELEWAKKYLYNSYIFRFDTPMNILSNYINIEYNNLPEDYYEKYLDNINNVKISDMLNEGSILNENGLIKVVVGSPDLKKRLKSFGEVVILK